MEIRHADLQIEVEDAEQVAGECRFCAFDRRRRKNNGTRECG